MVLFAHLYRRILTRGRVVGLLALSSVSALVFWLVALDGTNRGLARLYSDIVSSVGYTYAIAALILAAATLRDERDSGTLPYIYMRPIPRPVMAMQSIAAGAAAATVVGLGGWLASALVAWGTGGDPGLALPALSLFVAAGVGYAAVFVPLGYLVPRSLLVGLGYIVVVETILANVVTGLAQLSIWRISLSIYADLEGELGEGAVQSLGPVTPGAGGGMAKLAAILLAGFAVLTWALRTRDAL